MNHKEIIIITLYKEYTARSIGIKYMYMYMSENELRFKMTFNPFNPKLIIQILPTIQEEND